MTYLRRSLLIGGLALMAPGALAETIAQVAGDYAVAGRNRDGSGYAGTARINQFGSAIDITWIVNGSEFKGRGTLSSNVMEIEWSEPHPVVYVLRPDGALHGTWDNGRALDRLTPR